jgi:hypothetical protein
MLSKSRHTQFGQFVIIPPDYQNQGLLLLQVQVQQYQSPDFPISHGLLGGASKHWKLLLVTTSQLLHANNQANQPRCCIPPLLRTPLHLKTHSCMLHTTATEAAACVHRVSRSY